MTELVTLRSSLVTLHTLLSPNTDIKHQHIPGLKSSPGLNLATSKITYL